MPELPPDIVARLGAERVRQRLERERALLRRKGGRHPFSFTSSSAFRLLTGIGLRATGLSGRAYREFLDIRIIENTVALPSLPRAFDGFRLLQVSDLHSDIDPALIDRLLEILPRARFDRCVVTGDYHDITGTPWEKSVALTLRLVPRLGPLPLAILGNHDLLAKVVPLEAGGLRMLLNESVAIERDGARIWICGVDDAHTFRTHDLRAASAGIPADECRILLSHSPETWREAAPLGYALHLSGHTHGGQICLPGGFPIIRKAPVPRPLLAGPWREGAMLGYTSRGTGSCSVPARLNCPPEITIHILKCA